MGLCNETFIIIWLAFLDQNFKMGSRMLESDNHAMMDQGKRLEERI